MKLTEAVAAKDKEREALRADMQKKIDALGNDSGVLA